MPDHLESRLDQALALWRDRRAHDRTLHQQENRLIQAQVAAHRREMEKFAAEARAMLQNSLQRANRHMAKTGESCALRDISGHYTGPLHPSSSICNPIAFEFCTDGTPTGYPLLVELTSDGCISATIGYPSAKAPGGRCQTATSLDWIPVPLDRFDQSAADEIVAGYVTAAIAACCPGSAHRSEERNLGSPVWY